MDSTAGHNTYVYSVKVILEPKTSAGKVINTGNKRERSVNNFLWSGPGLGLGLTTDITINQWNLYEFRQKESIVRDYLQYAEDMH